MTPAFIHLPIVQRITPSHHATLGSGGQPTLTGRDSHPTGRNETFPTACIPYLLSSPSPRLGLAQQRFPDLAKSVPRTWQRPPTDSGLDGLVQDDIREEVLYREPIAHMLDQTVLSVAEDVRQVKLDVVERRDTRAGRLRDGRDHPVVVAIEPVGYQCPVLWPDQPVVGHPVALQQEEQRQRILTLVAWRHDLADPVRRQLDDAARSLWQPFFAPAGDVVARALVGLVGDADLSDDPPPAGAGLAAERAELHSRIALHDTVLGTRHGAAHDLAVDQLDPLLGARQQVGERVEFVCFHPLHRCFDCPRPC